jgi:hypothetical protein
MEELGVVWRMLIQVKLLILTVWFMATVLVAGTQLSPLLSASCGGCLLQLDQTSADGSWDFSDRSLTSSNDAVRDAIALESSGDGCCSLSGRLPGQTPASEERDGPHEPRGPCEPGDCECPMPCCGLVKTVMASIVGAGRGWVPMPHSCDPMPQYFAVSADHSDEIVHPPRA